MKNNNRLATLVLENNELGYSVENIKVLSEIIKQNHTLMLLNAQNNKLEASIIQLFESIEKNTTTLKILDLRLNDIRKLSSIKELITKVENKNPNIKIYY